MAHGAEVERAAKVIRALRATLAAAKRDERERITKSFLAAGYPPEVVQAAAAGLGGNGR